MRHVLDNLVGGNFINLPLDEAWHILEAHYEYSKTKGKTKPSVESSTDESHTNFISYNSLSHDSDFSPIGSQVCEEPINTDFACSYISPPFEDSSDESFAFRSLAHKDDPHLKTLGLEWEDSEPIASLHTNSHIYENSFSPLESLEDMLSIPAIELDAHPTLTTPGTIESLLPLVEHTHDTRLDEHTIESADPSSLTHTLEVESGAHLSPLDLAPPKSLIQGIVSEFYETDHHWGEVVDMRGTQIDFLGVERLLEPTMSIFDPFTGSYPGLLESHKAILFSSCSPLEAHPPLTLCEPEENILFLKPYVDAWDRLGVG